MVCVTNNNNGCIKTSVLRFIHADALTWYNGNNNQNNKHNNLLGDTIDIYSFIARASLDKTLNSLSVLVYFPQHRHYPVCLLLITSLSGGVKRKYLFKCRKMTSANG